MTFRLGSLAQGKTFLPAVLVILTLSARVAAQQASDLYHRGLVQEHAAGHLEDAIALYLQAARAAGADRALAARALMRAAGSYEKLGHQSDAMNVYAEVLRAYPEQRVEVSLAQERLNILRDASVGGSKKGVAVPMLDRYCVRCHNAGNRSGGFDLASIIGRHIGENTSLWEKVVRRLQARRDPPAGHPRPDGETYRAVTATLQQALDATYAANHSLIDAERSDDAELAVRIAKLLWDSAPDAPLLADAKGGRLREPGVLRSHVERMLRHPKAASLVDGFFARWLSLDKIRQARPDPSLYSQVDADLVQAMATETRLFLESQLREDRDAVEIWTANYTYVNARLARYYGLSGIAGDGFRRVNWPDDHRAGILGQAGILMALSRPSRTSPTTRGRFVLARFLGVDSPSPPANVPPLVEFPPAAAGVGTMRDRLLAHKINPSCGSCHTMFDPLGLALENFDAAGGWRTMDGGAPIDASGMFIDGTPFDGPAGLRAGLLKYRDAYYTSLTQQLLAYALSRNGRGGQVYDYEMSAVRQIVVDAAAAGYRWSSILAGIAASAPFQMKHLVP
jgi:tetratricopeptide (TPR) repeat protein